MNFLKYASKVSPVRFDQRDLFENDKYLETIRVISIVRW